MGDARIDVGDNLNVTVLIREMTVSIWKINLM
jgi:hypothetical protein